MTDEEFIKLASVSYSISNMMENLGLKPAGGNHNRYYIRAKSLNVVFASRPYVKSENKRNVFEYLVLNGPNIASSKLRLLLIKNNIKDDKCEECGIVKWNNKPISLHLDHIDGNRCNNLISNLRILCPNCHSQTDTYAIIKSGSKRRIILCNCGKPLSSDNKSGKCRKCLYPFVANIKKRKRLYTESKCKKCDVVLKRRKRNDRDYICRKCFDSQRITKISWPDNLPEMVANSSKLAFAKLLGVSDNAIAKRLKNHH